MLIQMCRGKRPLTTLGLQWADASGITVPFGQRGAGMRRLFMVAYFQYQAAQSMHEEMGPHYIFAIEEPEVHLHPGAQRVLLKALQDLVDAGNTVLFTTHSPTFASTVPIRDIALVQRDSTSSSIKKYPSLDCYDLATELGVEASDRLVGRNYIVLVEGPGDVGFYSVVLEELYKAGDIQLDPSMVVFLPCGGLGSLKYWVNTRRMDEAGLAWALITDSDRGAAGGEPSLQVQAVINGLPETCKYAYVLQRSFIENYLDPEQIKAVTGINCRIPRFGKGTTPSGGKLSKGAWNKIKANGHVVAQKMGSTGLKNHSMLEDGRSEWVLLFDELRARFGM